MHLKFLFLFYLLLTNIKCHGEYLSLTSGFQNSQHGYLSDVGSLNTQVLGAKLDLSQWRRTQKGWLARGVSAEYAQGINYSNLKMSVPIFHWHPQQGLWLEVSSLSQNLDIEISNDETLLNNSGLSTAITAGSTLSAGHNINQFNLYWYESSRQTAPMNIIGGFFYSEASPAGSTISGSTATVFDGVFTGYGMMLGRKKDDKGLNFQWRLHLAQMNMDFSDGVTSHRAASQSESTSFKLGLDVGWHYRYYLMPYWYLVPEVKVGLNALTQTQVAPVEIEHRPLIFIEQSLRVSLERRF